MARLSKYHLKPKIVVSGGAETQSHDERTHCGPLAYGLARKIGAEIARRGGIVVTGATTGVPYHAAIGAKKAGGFVVGLSPAASKREHIKKYRLPVDYHDIIIYTGFEYAGRNLLLTRVGDGIISICGHMGTLNEFTIAFEEKKPIAILEGPWETDDLIKEMIKKSRRGPGKTVYDRNPKTLVSKLLALIKKEEVRNHRYLRRNDGKLPQSGD